MPTSSGITQLDRATTRSVISIRLPQWCITYTAAVISYCQTAMSHNKAVSRAAIEHEENRHATRASSFEPHDRRHVGLCPRHCDTPAVPSSHTGANVSPGPRFIGYSAYVARASPALPLFRGPMTGRILICRTTKNRWPNFCGASSTKTKRVGGRGEAKRDDSPIGPPVVSLIPGCKRVMYAAINRNEHSRAFFRGAIFRRIYDPRHAKREMNYTKRRRCFHVVRLVSSSREK